MGGRTSLSGMGGATLQGLGLKIEDSIDPDMFRNHDARYGGYAYELASDVAEYMDEDSILVSYEQGGNKAYAVLTKGSESLDAIVSTGGGTGTKLLLKIMKYMQGQGRGMFWITDNDASRSYYNSMGLGKFKMGKSMYQIDASQIGDAIKMVNRRVK